MEGKPFTTAEAADMCHKLTGFADGESYTFRVNGVEITSDMVSINLSSHTVNINVPQLHAPAF